MPAPHQTPATIVLRPSKHSTCKLIIYYDILSYFSSSSLFLSFSSCSIVPSSLDFSFVLPGAFLFSFVTSSIELFVSCVSFGLSLRSPFISSLISVFSLCSSSLAVLPLHVLHLRFIFFLITFFKAFYLPSVLHLAFFFCSSYSISFSIFRFTFQYLFNFSLYLFDESFLSNK